MKIPTDTPRFSSRVLPSRSLRASSFAAVLLSAVFVPLTAQTTSWDQDADGLWFTSGNWDNGVPDASGDEALFDFALTADRTVTLDADATVGKIEFNSAGFSTTITGSNLLTFDGGSAPLINYLQGADNRIATDIAAGSQVLDIDGDGLGTGLTLSGTITGTGGLNKDSDASTLEVLGNNSGLSGMVDIRGGRLGVGHDNALGTGDIDIRNNTEYYAVGGDRTLSNILDFNTSQASIFDGANGYDFTFTGDGSVGNIGHINGANLTFTGDIEIATLLVENGSTGLMRFNGSLTTVGTATVTDIDSNGVGGRVELYGDNWDSVSSTGLVVDEIRDSVVVGIGHDQALGDPTAKWLTVFDATLEAVGGDRTIQNDIGIRAVTGGLGLHFAGDDYDITMTGNLTNHPSGSGELFKEGDHTLTLDGDLSYTDGTQVLGGTLLINGDASAATGAVTVSSGATIGGTGTIGGATTIENGAILSPGNSIGTITLAGGLTLDPGSEFDIDLGSSTTSDLILVTGGTFTSSGSANPTLLNINLFSGAGAGVYDILDVSGIGGSISNLDFDFGDVPVGFAGTIQTGGAFDILQVNITAVPEPGTYALILGLAGFCLVLVRRRSFRANTK